MTERAARRSITRTLAITLAMLFAGGGILVAVAALAYGRTAADQSFDRILLGAATQIAGALSLRDGQVSVDIPASAFDLLALAKDDRIAYAVIGPGDDLLTGYPDLPRPRGEATFYTAALTGEPARFAIVTRLFAERTFSGTVQVIVGQTTRARRELAQSITSRALLLVGAVGLVLSSLAVFAVRSALRPLARIEDRLSVRPSRDLTPIDLDVPREIGGLVDTLNGFMARIDRQIAAMRTLIADASHQLRTPVAALRAQAELAADETDPKALRDISERVRRRAVTLGRLTDQLLSHAMIIHRADTASLEPVDLRAVAARAVAESDNELLVSDTELLLDLPEDRVDVAGDTLSLVEATKNLIGNALRHGQPPVTVRVLSDRGMAVIAVHDRGAGFAESEWPDAATRFSRSSGVSATSAGLGLAIVDAVAKAHGGALVFQRPEIGGFQAGMSMPVLPVNAT